jgi:eukaryotic-like serine/threonine-protein kinase
VKSCVVCQTELKDDAGFCPNCGAEQPRQEVAAGDDPLLGAIVARKFKVEKVLGVGGMGKVYKARQLTLDKAVVVKVLHDHFRDDPQLVQRFQREARAASRLNHPNSIQIIDFGQDEGGVVFMAMEFLQGQDLFAVLKKDGALAPDRVVRIMIQVCSALAEAHEQNVIHRDLKPENIMVEDRRGQRDFVKVLDFGIAKIQDPGESAGQALTQAGMVCGTPEYMSPEQARGLQLDPRSDIYALGVVMYQLATGQLPFTSDTPIGIVTKHILEKPDPPSQRNAGVPPGLEEIILKALEKEVDNRFTTVVQMGEALERLLLQMPSDSSSSFLTHAQVQEAQSGSVTTGSRPNPIAGPHTEPSQAHTLPTPQHAQPPPQPPVVVHSEPHQPAPLPASSGGNGMKFAAIAAVGVLLLGGGAVFALRDSLFGGPSPAAADAGVAVVVADAGAAAAGTDQADAGAAADPTPTPTPTPSPSLTAVPDPTPRPTPTPTPTARPTPTPTATPSPTPTAAPSPTKGDRAKAQATHNKAVALFNKRFTTEGCDEEIFSLFVTAAQQDPSFADPMRYISQCHWKAKNFSPACQAAKEFERRGAPAAAAQQLQRMSCNK